MIGLNLNIGIFRRFEKLLEKPRNISKPFLEKCVAYKNRWGREGRKEWTNKGIKEWSEEAAKYHNPIQLTCKLQPDSILLICQFSV